MPALCRRLPDAHRHTELRARGAADQSLDDAKRMTRASTSPNKRTLRSTSKRRERKRPMTCTTTTPTPPRRSDAPAASRHDGTRPNDLHPRARGRRVAPRRLLVSLGLSLGLALLGSGVSGAASAPGVTSGAANTPSTGAGVDTARTARPAPLPPGCSAATATPAPAASWAPRIANRWCSAPTTWRRCA